MEDREKDKLQEIKDITIGMFNAILLLLLAIGGIITPFVWIYFNDIHMDPQAWFVLIILGIGVVNYIGSRG